MPSRAGIIVTTALLSGALVGGAGAASAASGGPVVTRGGGTETFADDLFLDLCGIETETTLTETWTLKEFPDGSSTLQDERTFVPADPRLPVEKGAATSFNAPDGSRRVVGKPIQIISRTGGGTRILDAGQVWFDADGDAGTMHGPHPSLTTDLAEYYCP